MANKTSEDIQILDVDNWKKGVISYFSKSRLQHDALKAGYNVIFDYNAIVRPRGSFNQSGIPDIPEKRVADGAPTVRRNLATNPSFENNTSGYYLSGTGTGSMEVNGDWSDSGSKSCMFTTTNASDARDIRFTDSYTTSALLPGKTYTVSATVRYTDTILTNNDRSPGILIFTRVSGGTYIANHGAKPPKTPGVYRVSQTFTVPIGADAVLVGLGCSTGVAGMKVWWDSVLIEESPVVLPYFDGSTANKTLPEMDITNAWAGAPHASVSTSTLQPVTVTVPQPLAQDFAFKRKDRTEGLLNIFTDGTDAYLYVLKPDITGWTKFNVPFDSSAPFTFSQIADTVVIGNGVDKFSYYDIGDNALRQLTKVPDPTATPTATTAGFVGTNAFDYFYRVSLNGVGGSTKMTPWVKVSSSTIRDTWGSSKSVAINISGFTIPSTAESWNLHVAMVSTGTGTPTDTEYFTIAEDLPLTQKSYTDTGEVTLLTSAPIENTTEGIKAWYFTNISGRLFAIDNDGVVHWGGNIGSELYFGSANGSDSYQINNGSGEQPMAITLGRDNAGTTCINLLTRTMAGQGAIWDVYATTNSITANGQTFSTGTYQFKKREGDDGTDAPFSVIRANNNAYYLSMDGFKSTGVKPNVSGIQSTDIISSAIRDRVLNLAQSNLTKTYAAYFDEALYWTIAYGSQENNEIWVYDMLHGGIWSIFRIKADCIFRWASTRNESPSLYIRQGNKLLRYYKDSRTHADEDSVFESYIESGLIPFGESNLEWVHLLKNIWQFDQAIGSIDVTVNIHAKNGDIIKTAHIPFNNVSSSNIVHGGWDATKPRATGSSIGAWDYRSWDETLAGLLGIGDDGDKKVDQKIRKNAAYISFKIRANTENTYYELSHLSLLFTYIGNGMEFLTQKGVIKV